MPNRYKTDNKQSEVVYSKIPTKPIFDSNLKYIIRYDTENLVFDNAKDKSKENLFLGTVDKVENLRYSPYPNSDPVEFEEIGQSTSNRINEIEQIRDDNGFTNPNLHRRIDAQMSENTDEVVPRKYRFGIHNWNSYRTTHVVTHIDYTDLVKYADDEDYDQILIRFEECEKREIP